MASILPITLNSTIPIHPSHPTVQDTFLVNPTMTPIAGKTTGSSETTTTAASMTATATTSSVTVGSGANALPSTMVEVFSANASTKNNKIEQEHRGSNIFVFSSAAQTAATAAAPTVTEEEQLIKDIKQQQELEMQSFVKAHSRDQKFAQHQSSLTILHERELKIRYDLNDAITQYPANTILPEQLEQYLYFRLKWLGFVNYENELDQLLYTLMPQKIPPILSTRASQVSLASPISEGSPIPQPLSSPLGSPITQVIDSTDHLNFEIRIADLRLAGVQDPNIITRFKTGIKEIFHLNTKLELQDADIDALITDLRNSMPQAEKALQLCFALYKIHNLESQTASTATATAAGQTQTTLSQSKASYIGQLATLYSNQNVSPMLNIDATISALNDRAREQESCCVIL